MSARAAGPRYVAPRLPPRPELWSVGDAAAGTATARRVARLVRRASPDLLLYLGDVYPSGTLRDFKLRYDPLYGALARRTAPTPGNHDWPNARSGYLRYWRAKLGRPLPSYYAFRAPGWQLLSLNSELRGRTAVRQRAWLARRLRGRACRIAFFHTPRFSAGMHGDAPRLQGIWWLIRRRVRLVINAHDHDLQVLNPPGGATILVTGAGGAPRYPLDRRHRFLAWGDYRHAGALRVRLSPTRARYAFVDASGHVLRRGEVACRR